MTTQEKINKAVKRGSFKYAKKEGPTGFKYGPNFTYKKTMSHKEPLENETLIRGSKRSAPHFPGYKFLEPPTVEERLKGVYLGWKEIAKQSQKPEERTREEVKKGEK